MDTNETVKVSATLEWQEEATIVTTIGQYTKQLCSFLLKGGNLRARIRKKDTLVITLSRFRLKGLAAKLKASALEA